MRDNCRAVAALVSDYIDEVLEPRTQALVTAHIETCEHCRHEVELTKALVTRLTNLSGNSVPVDLWDGVAARLPERRIGLGLVGRIRTAFNWRMIALPAAVAAAATLIFAVKPSEPPTAPSASVEYNAYMQAYSGFRGQQVLSDRAAITAASQLQRREAVPQ